ncbi:MAG: protein-disulfide reductase DsbD [Legionellales bacterium]|nr:protein-disulfide reductase DsbD [Legionellales bacterium]
MKILICGLFFFSCSVSAANIFELNDNPLPVDQAYHFSATRHDNVIDAHWQMAKGYYLYQTHFCFVLNDQTIKSVPLPPAERLQDEVLGTFNVYSNQLNIQIPVPSQYAEQSVQFGVCYQGCSSGHFCYPPVKQTLVLPPNTSQAVTGQSQTVSSQPPLVPEQDHLTALLVKGSIWLGLLSFFGLGLLLSFTPCVLPMIPILSGLIIGHEGISTVRAAWISLTYVLSMALTYALIGIVAGLAGANLQTLLQTPIAIVLMCLLFVLLALSLFGCYEIHLPQALQQRLTSISNHQKTGSFIGAALMGCLATLIVSPCVSPALIAAVTYIAETGKVVMGGLALFVMALGMGVPLLLVGTFGGRMLPRTGHWMETIKQVIGVFMLMVALILLDRIVPQRLYLVLWASLLIICSIYLGLLQAALTGWSKLWKGIGLLFAIMGTILLVGAAEGNGSIFQPLTPTNAQAKTTSAEFAIVNTNNALENLLEEAKKSHKITVLDFYAKWCLSCKEMDMRTFRNPKVRQAMQGMQRVQVDMTTDTPDIKAIKKQYQVVAPPTVIFLDANGQEIPNTRIVGAVSAKAFLERVEGIK